MNLARMSELALVRWHGFREFRHLSHNEIVLIVAVVGGLALIVWAVQHRRRRWL